MSFLRIAADRSACDPRTVGFTGLEVDLDGVEVLSLFLLGFWVKALPSFQFKTFETGVLVVCLGALLPRANYKIGSIPIYFKRQ